MTIASRSPKVMASNEISKAWVDRLAATESPAFTARRKRRTEQTGIDHDPIVWKRAFGSNVFDVDGNRFIDLTSGFGASVVGHSHPFVVQAVSEQALTLTHALGDLHPSETKIRALERLQSIAPFPDARSVIALNGSDAVEVALKTAVLYTGRSGVLAFDGSYHGLANGPLAVSGYKDSFRRPFSKQLNTKVCFAQWPASTSSIDVAIAQVVHAWDTRNFKEEIGAIIFEPLQGRGGVRVAPEGFARALKELCRRRGAVLIADEIFTGLGRCGTRWLSANGDQSADLICAGKALGGGFPISACIGRPEVMGAWGRSEHYAGGEAIHTGTFYGHPVGCAAMLATLDIIDACELVERAERVGRVFQNALEKHGVRVQGRGLMLGVDTGRPGGGVAAMQKMLKRGYICLPAGTEATILQLAPALNIEEAHLLAAADHISEVLHA